MMEKTWKGPIFGTAASFAVLDPAYTMSVPPMQVLSGAFDTLSHAMETYLGTSDEDNVSDDVALAIMRNTVVNMRRLLKDINDVQARSNLMWDSAMAENGILKCGRLTDFQAHQMEHQLGGLYRLQPRTGTGSNPSCLLSSYRERCTGEICPVCKGGI